MSRCHIIRDNVADALKCLVHHHSIRQKISCHLFASFRDIYGGMMEKMGQSFDYIGATDAHLVAQCLAGNREAFGQIVARYQTLVCSLAYSGTGSLSQSEDLAQETFLLAYRRLASLREPEKLRSWLCGIARIRIGNARRQQGREPTHGAQPLDTLGANEPPAHEPHPREAAISREEQAILWQAVERIPGLYREPLILFYRERNSVEIVAQLLDLTEDTVRQRLSRGRKLLQEQVLAFVEGALEQTSPSQTFTLGVLAALAALPTMSIPAKAAALGAAGAAGKGAAAAKGVTLGSIISILIVPAVGVFFAFIGAFFGYRLRLKAARTPRERAFVRRFSNVFLFTSFPIYISFITLLFVMIFMMFSVHLPWRSFPFVMLVTFAWAIFIFAGASRFDRKFTAMRAEELKLHPELFPRETLPPVLEYRSRATFLGLPLIHIRYRRGWGVEKKPAAGWIALGETARGIIFACGQTAVGGISLGSVSIGIISAGALSFGLLAMGLLALGVFAQGWMAAGWGASGLFSLGMYATGLLNYPFYQLIYGRDATHMSPLAERLLSTFLCEKVAPWQTYAFWIFVTAIAPALLSGILSTLAKAWLLRKARKQVKTDFEEP